MTSTPAFAVNAVPFTADDMPRLGTGLACAGRREAIRVFHEFYFDLPDYLTDECRYIHEGPSPVEFKTAFFETLSALTDAIVNTSA